MRNFIIASLFALVCVNVGTLSAYAETGKERQAACSQEWKDKKAAPGYVKPAKGEGRAAWNAFRSECTARRKAVDANANPVEKK